MKESAGTLLYRHLDGGIEVLIVHPSGNFNRHAPWSIPKGLPEEGESLEETARRETLEETGVTPGPLEPLGSIVYTKSRKHIHAFAGECARDTPNCASWEVDRAEFVLLDKARELLHPEQRPFIDRLEALLSSR